ncbi:hypothetical protein [Campylobacter concisus]|nr:hypothetical protein [Campylobacter concisus]
MAIPIPNLYAAGKRSQVAFMSHPSRVVAITDRLTFCIIAAKTIG